MTPEQKLEYLQRQCEAQWERGCVLDISCPYCFHVTPANSQEGPCCQLMDLAVHAILERAKAVEEAMECHRRREFGRMIMGDKNYLN